MNDMVIRQCFHRKRLKKYHDCVDALVVDELGLKHGKCRADIAIINGRIIGYEIKSNRDSLCRLDEQIKNYSLVFDRASIIVGSRHLDAVAERLPKWWGIIYCLEGARGAVSFRTLRRPKLNSLADPFSVVELLWRDEAEEMLRARGAPKKTLRQKRSVLYRRLLELIDYRELHDMIRHALKTRQNWRCRE